MALIVQRTGHIEYARQMFAKSFHLAWGDLVGAGFAGDVWPDNDNPPIPTVNETVLYNEVGRQRVRGDAIGDGNKYVDVVNMNVQSVTFNLTDNTLLCAEQYPTGVAGKFTIIGDPVSGALPTGLNTSDTFYLYYDHTSGLNKVATTFNNALNGTIIDISGSNAGTYNFTALTDNLIYSSGKYWMIVDHETPNVYLQFAFDRLSASTSFIHQIGLFVDTVLVEGVPPGQEYYIPAEISDPGTLIMFENLPKISRNTSTYETFDIVIEF